MTKEQLNVWLKVYKHWNEWFGIEERGLIMNVLERFHTETAQRIVLEAIARISVYEERDKNKVRDDICSNWEFKDPFKEAEKSLKDRKISENYEKQIEIAQELASKVDLLNQINALWFGYHKKLDSSHRKGIYQQIKQLRRDQRTTLLRKIRDQDGNFKIEYIKALFKDVCLFLSLLLNEFKYLEAF